MIENDNLFNNSNRLSATDFAKLINMIKSIILEANTKK